ncbi:Plasmodium exported protein, unknown function [Plasmodium vivax]|uniref:Uncharacterized protein n=1 Tax=Plasmodium vivax TaxID=5855 RepID=A0A565A450_PLAVI|nr:Plasmodium exported protein, unknown function [Plasmodium vivax]
MLFLYNAKMMNKLHLTFFFNIVSLTFLTWINHRGNEVGNHNIYLCMNFINGNTGKVRNDRLLTNDDAKSDIGQSDPSDNITLPGEKNNLKNITGTSEIHERVKMDTENSMHAYIKKLEHGYLNKKGLKRLDCHYEKKLFNEMYKLDKIAGHMKSKNSYFKKVIWKRYGLRFFIFSLVIIFGIAISILGYISSIKGDSSDISCTTNDQKPCSVCKNMLAFLPVPNIVLFFPLTIAYLSFVIYILSKVRKYKRLKRKYYNISLM